MRSMRLMILSKNIEFFSFTGIHSKVQRTRLSLKQIQEFKPDFAKCITAKYIKGNGHHRQNVTSLEYVTVELYSGNIQ